jgi:hypothetical protein
MQPNAGEADNAVGAPVRARLGPRRMDQGPGAKALECSDLLSVGLPKSAGEAGHTQLRHPQDRRFQGRA